MPGKVIVVPRGPAMGSAAELISKVIEVAVRYGNYVVRPDYYRACLSGGEQVRKVIGYSDYSWDLYDEAYRIFKIASQRVENGCHLHPWSCSKGAWFKDIGVAITRGDGWFCLTLFTDKWEVDVIPAE